MDFVLNKRFYSSVKRLLSNLVYTHFVLRACISFYLLRCNTHKESDFSLSHFFFTKALIHTTSLSFIFMLNFVVRWSCYRTNFLSFANYFCVLFKPQTGSLLAWRQYFTCHRASLTLYLSLYLLTVSVAVDLTMSNNKGRHNDLNLDARMIITVAEYDKLIERSEKLTVYEKKYADELKETVKSKISEPSETDAIENSDENSDQTGSGTNDLLATIQPTSEEIEQDLPKLYDEPTSAPPAFNHTVHLKSKQSSPEADQTLINLLPARLKPKGEKPLSALLTCADSITWADTGFVTINHISIPNSNFYEIFPKLFKFIQNSDKVIGLSEVITIIATLGFGSLINKRYLTGLLRPHKIINHDSLLEDTRNLKNWWFLG